MNKKKRFLIFIFICVLIICLLSIFLLKASIFQWIIPISILLAIIITNQKTDSKALLFLIGIAVALVSVVIVVVLAILAKSNPAIMKMLTFPN